MSRQQRIEQALQTTFEPTHMVVTNDSHRHAVAPGSETHFTILIVSEQFTGLTRIERQRRVHSALAGELDAGLHALAIRALAPTEFDRTATFVAPDCLGGSKAAAVAEAIDTDAPTPRAAEAAHE
jgi:BolA protein